MITETQYLEAKKIVDAYTEQLRIADVVRSKRLAEEQKKREDACDEHYFIEDGKWTSTSTCQFCGKRI